MVAAEMQDRLTTDKLMARTSGASRPQLYFRTAWEKVRVWTHYLVQVPANESDVLDWWHKPLAGLPKKLRRLKAAIMMYTSSNIWKARNRRVFDQLKLNVVQVFQEIKSEMFVRKMACGAPEILDPP